MPGGIKMNTVEVLLLNTEITACWSFIVQAGETVLIVDNSGGQ